MTLDSHRHFWHYTPEEFGWIEDAALKRDFLPQGEAASRRLESNVSASGETPLPPVDPCIAVEARQCVEETEWLLLLAERHSFIKGVVGWLPIAAPDFPEVLERYLSHAESQRGRGRRGETSLENSALSAPLRETSNKLVGLRHVVQDEPDDGFILRPDFVRGVRHLLSRDLAYDILVFERHLPNVIKFVDALPDDARLVLDHLGKPCDFATWKPLLLELGKRQNVYCKVSGLVTEIGAARWEQRALPYLDAAVESFGTERLMFGSDWPVVTAHTTYEAWKECVAPLGEAVMCANAECFYRIPTNS